MTRRIYVASSWRNTLQPDVVEILRGDGHEVYDFRHPSVGYDNPTGVTAGFEWDEIDPNWQEWTVNGYLEALRHKVSERGFQSDWQAMHWADTGVLILPSGRSAHIEAGWMVGAGKPVYILLTEPQEPELMYLMVTKICPSITDLLDVLRYDS